VKTPPKTRATDVTNSMPLEEYRKLTGAGTPAKRSKYNAQRVKRGGYTFDSKLEASYYDDLCRLLDAEKILYFLCQVPFRLPGGVVYRADFMVVYPEVENEYERWRIPLSVEFWDVKGRDTPMSKMKRRQVEALYPVTILLKTGKRGAL